MDVIVVLALAQAAWRDLFGDLLDRELRMLPLYSKDIMTNSSPNEDSRGDIVMVIEQFLPVSSTGREQGRLGVRRGVVIAISMLLPAVAFGQTDEPVGTYSDALADTTTNGSITGEAILSTCRTGANGQGAPNNQRFQADCNLVVGGASSDPSGSSNALEQLAGDQINAQNSTAVRTASAGIAVVEKRLQRVRVAGGLSGDQGVRVATTAFTPLLSGGGASADLAAGAWGGFLNYDWAGGNEDMTSFQPGYDYSRWSLTGGVDYRFSDSFVSGVALRYTGDDVDIDQNRGSMTGETWGVTAYASYFLPSGVFFDGSIGYANTGYDMKREINYTVAGTAVHQIAKSDPDADVWSVSLGAGYDLFVNAFSITPSLRFSYVENSVDGYRERMSDPTAWGGSMALAVDSQTYKSLTSNLGVQISRAISTGSGVLVPQLRLGWIHEYENDQEQVGATFVNDINNTPFYILTSEPDNNYFEAGVGLSAQFSNGRSAFLAYNTLLGYEDVSYHAITAGMRLEF